MTDLYAEFAPAAPQGALPRAPLQLSCVVPAHNEEANLEAFLHALVQKLQTLTPDFEIVVVNDGSRDSTHEIAMRLSQTLPVRYLALSRNFGKEAALSAGIDHARGNAVLLIDAFLKENGIEGIEPLHIGLWAIPTAIAALVIHMTRLLRLDASIRRDVMAWRAEQGTQEIAP